MNQYHISLRFLLEINDQGLYKHLEDHEWSYLLEVFSTVEPWTEAYHLPERVTWIQVTGIPLHCWNHITFKRLAEVWGKMIALGENATQFKDCEKVTILVSTNQWKRLDGTIELEVGREYFLIRVEELSSSVQYGKPGRITGFYVAVVMVEIKDTEFGAGVVLSFYFLAYFTGLLLWVDHREKLLCLLTCCIGWLEIVVVIFCVSIASYI
ncbi:hypothetical protein V6N13_065409 [Hibiscus sabdariffa]